MKRAFCTFLLLMALFIPQAALAYEGMENIPYGIVMKTNALEEAVCQAALIFHGVGYWEDAEVFTAGCKILENRVEDDRCFISAMIASCSCDTDSGDPQVVASACYPARLEFAIQADGTYALQSYLYVDSGKLVPQYKELFSDDTCSLLLNTESKAELFQTALDNAIEEAKKFIRAQNGENISGVWREVLKAGSNSQSKELLIQQDFWDYNYPCFEGFVIWHDVLYQLSVEEEYSYSGKLRFLIYDSSGKRADHIVRIQNNDVIYLDE